MEESKSLVTMSNSMARASYRLGVNEIRLLLVAMAQMPKGDSDEVIDPMKPYYITKDDFVRLGVEPKNVAREIRAACSDLLDRKIFINTPIGVLGTHWVHNILHFKSEVFEALKRQYPDSKYDEDFLQQLKMHNLLDSLPVIASSDENVIARVVFHTDIIPYISQLKQQFTKLNLNDLAGFNSFYGFRIYILMMQFAKTGYVSIRLDEFREILGLTDKYDAVKDLKKRVLDTAIKEIDEKSPYNVKYEMSDKNGRSGRGIKLTHLQIRFKPKAKTVSKTIKKTPIRDPNTIDMFTGQTANEAKKPLTDKQLARIVHSKKFMQDYSYRITAQNPANKSSKAWIDHMTAWLKKDPETFNKRPMKEYLDDEQADRF